MSEDQCNSPLVSQRNVQVGWTQREARGTSPAEVSGKLQIERQHLGWTKEQEQRAKSSGESGHKGRKCGASTHSGALVNRRILNATAESHSADWGFMELRKVSGPE